MNKKAKPKIINFDVNWSLIKSACMTTVGKQDKKEEPTTEWKRKILIAEHSPIRRSNIYVKWEQIPSYVSTHLARHHEGIEKYIQTSREDRTDIPREERKQTDMVSMQMDFNIQGLINVMSKRLCTCADKTTREYMMDLKEEIKKYDEDISWSLVPSCVRCGGCIEEFSNCSFYEKLIEGMSKEELINVKERYNTYNEFVKVRRK